MSENFLLKESSSFSSSSNNDVIEKVAAKPKN